MRNFLLALALLATLSVIDIGMAQTFKSIDVEVTPTFEESIGLKYPNSGMKYWVVDLNIKNNGLPEFSIRPEYFIATAEDGVDYTMDKATYYLGSKGKVPLHSANLTDGQTAKGSLAFMIPTSVNKLSLSYKENEDKFNFI
jgi:hypothetical protein